MIIFDHVGFHYGGENATGEGVDDINLRIAPGEVVMFCGRSGCGKTTLTRLINGLAPHFYPGELTGSVHVGGVCVSQGGASDVSALVGSVFQNPKSQFFNIDTTSELAFGCENQGLSREIIHQRVSGASRDLELANLMDRNIFDLSGGEKQQIACGSVYAADPQVYVLDEPSSNLDRKAMRRLHALVVRLKQQGKTIVLSEHRLYYLMDVVDRFVYLRDGRVAREFSRDEMASLGDDELAELGLRVTSLQQLRTIAAGWTSGSEQQTPASRAVDVVDLTCHRGGAQILDVERFSIPTGAVVAFIGDNGSGKTTLAESLCGVIPASGSIAFNGNYRGARARTRRSFLVMQDVNRQLFGESVLEEALLNSKASREQAIDILTRLDLDAVSQRHPASLSGGQKQRVAIASAVCADKEILFYDEPTSGLDRLGMESFSDLLATMRHQVGAQIIVTHDPELIMRSCTHALHLDNGRVTGFYPLNDEGRERVLSYFTSLNQTNTSPHRKRMGMVEKVMGYAGGHQRQIYLAAALMTLGAALSIIPYMVIHQMIARAISGQELSVRSAWPALAGIVGCEVAYAAAYVYGLQLSHRAAYAILENLRREVQKRFDQQPLGNAQQMGTGAVKKLFVDDIEGIELLLAHMIPEGIANTVVPAAALIVMIAVDWRLALLFLLMVVFGLLASGQMYLVGMGRMGNYFASAKRLNNTIIEYVNGMEVVRVFNRSQEASEKLQQAVFSYRDFALKWFEVSWPWMAVYGSIFATATLYSLPFGAWLVVQGQLGLADYVLVLCLSFGIGPLIGRVAGFFGAVPMVNRKIQALEKAMDRPPLATGDAELGPEDKDVVFCDVRFGYGASEVLKGISFVAREHQMTAFVGPSGSGKSTIARLIAHYYDVDSGSVCIGSHDIRDVTLDSLNNKVSYVSQDLFLFNTSILENIRIGCPQATDQQVREAARRARCEEFVAGLPQGYLTTVGAAGGRLSGGQRQRIALARAILKDAPIVVLDEATAYIDPENEALMNAAIQELVRDKTLIVIAHRLHTIVSAAMIHVLRDGRITASGTHQDLLAASPDYQALWEASHQAGGWTLRGAARC